MVLLYISTHPLKFCWLSSNLLFISLYHIYILQRCHLCDHKQIFLVFKLIWSKSDLAGWLITTSCPPSQHPVLHCAESFGHYISKLLFSADFDGLDDTLFDLLTNEVVSDLNVFAALVIAWLVCQSQ